MKIVTVPIVGVTELKKIMKTFILFTAGMIGGVIGSLAVLYLKRK